MFIFQIPSMLVAIYIFNMVLHISARDCERNSIAVFTQCPAKAKWLLLGQLHRNYSFQSPFGCGPAKA